MPIIGAQLFTVREACKTLPALGDTLCRLSDMGYKAVQVSGTCAYTPEQLSALLNKAKVVCPLTHYDFNRILHDTEAVIDEHTRFGCDYIGIGSLPNLFTPEGITEADLEALIPEMKIAAKKIAAAGKRLMYHNHDREYTTYFGGKCLMEILNDAFAPGELGFTLDLYWVQRGGRDPLSEIRRLSGRIPCVHLKDIEADTLHFAPVGSGIQDYPTILPALEKAGCRYAFVEQDNCYGQDAFECLQRSLSYLKALQ